MIATPTNTHYALCKAALAAGKDVLVEKPIAARADEAVELTALAERERPHPDGRPRLPVQPGVRRVRAYLEAGDARAASTSSRWCAPTSGRSART